MAQQVKIMYSRQDPGTKNSTLGKNKVNVNIEFS